MTGTYDYDLFVIGGGSGGVRASRMAAGHGARVAIAEEYAFGGTCVIRGCIPKKLFVYASHYVEDFEDAGGFGWTVPRPKFDWNVLVANKDKEIARLEGLYHQNVDQGRRRDHHGARRVPGPAHDPSEEVGPHSHREDTSSSPPAAGPARDMGDCVGAEHAITSNEAFHLDKLPHRIIVAGGGYIAVEFANIFHGLGCEVTLVYRRDKILRGFDEDMRDCADRRHEQEGHAHRHQPHLQARRQARATRSSRLTDHGEILEADALMLAIGRVPNTDGLGLEKAGVEIGRTGEVMVDDYSQHQCRAHLCHRRCHRPSAAHAGRDPRGHGLRARRSMRASPRRSIIIWCPRRFSASRRSAPSGSAKPTRWRPATPSTSTNRASARSSTRMTGREERSLFKMIVDAGTDRVLGCHIFGPGCRRDRSSSSPWP